MRPQRIFSFVGSWEDFERDAPDLAERVRHVFAHRKHKALATLRRDGSPRLTGIEVEFDAGEIWLGMMPGSLKARDVRRDPRLSLLAASDDPPEEDPGSWEGDARVSGRAVEVPAEDPSAGHRFKIDIDEVVLTRVGTPSDHLLIASWRPGRGINAVKRK